MLFLAMNLAQKLYSFKWKVAKRFQRQIVYDDLRGGKVYQLGDVGNHLIMHWHKIVQTEILSLFIISGEFLSALYFHELPIIIKWLNDQLKTSSDCER